MFLVFVRVIFLNYAYLQYIKLLVSVFFQPPNIYQRHLKFSILSNTFSILHHIKTMEHCITTKDNSTATQICFSEVYKTSANTKSSDFRHKFQYLPNFVSSQCPKIITIVFIIVTDLLINDIEGVFFSCQIFLQIFWKDSCMNIHNNLSFFLSILYFYEKIPNQTSSQRSPEFELITNVFRTLFISFKLPMKLKITAHTYSYFNFLYLKELQKLLYSVNLFLDL